MLTVGIIGGTTEATLQQRVDGGVNAIGERVSDWTILATLFGWLDLSDGDSKYSYSTKRQESTHVFLCDYVSLNRSAEGKRLVVGDQVFDVLLIDDPMELHQQLEIYLNYIGVIMDG